MSLQFGMHYATLDQFTEIIPCEDLHKGLLSTLSGTTLQLITTLAEHC